MPIISFTRSIRKEEVCGVDFGSVPLCGENRRPEEVGFHPARVTTDVLGAESFEQIATRTEDRLCATNRVAGEGIAFSSMSALTGIARPRALCPDLRFA